jgi:hypothetical protein
MKKQDPGPGSGSISQRHGFADPDPHQNVIDPQHYVKVTDRKSQNAFSTLKSRR